VQVDSQSVYISLVSTVFGVLLSLVIQLIIGKYRFKRELKHNNDIDISGDDWHAAWQTSVNNKELLNSERLTLLQKGGTVRIWNQEKSPENPEGGYLWEGKLQFFFGRDLMGWYFAKKEEQNTSKGIMFFYYNSARKTFVGKWVGSAFDGPLSTGFVVISKERQKSINILKGIVSEHSSEIAIISQD